GRPQDAGDPVEGEVAFEDGVVEASLGGEVKGHGRAFRECAGTALPGDLSPDRVPGREYPRRCVHGYHLLVLQHGLAEPSSGRPGPPTGFPAPFPPFPPFLSVPYRDPR